MTIIIYENLNIILIIFVLQMQKVRGKLACKNYGYDCSFMTNEIEIKEIIKEFREHALQEHFIDYPDGIFVELAIKNLDRKLI